MRYDTGTDMITIWDMVTIWGYGIYPILNATPSSPENYKCWDGVDFRRKKIM